MNRFFLTVLALNKHIKSSGQVIIVISFTKIFYKLVSSLYSSRFSAGDPFNT